MTEKQLQLLRHMLGIDDPSKAHPKSHRDYAAVNPGDPDFIAMEEAGAVRRYEPRLESEYHWYTTTDEGKRLAHESHKATRWPKSKRVYSAFLNISDVLPDLTFMEFLRDPQFKELRASA